MQRIGFVVYPGFQIGCLVAATVIELANRAADAPVYSVELLSEAGGPVRSAIGADVLTQPISSRTYDTLIIAPATGIPQPSAGLVEILRTAPDRCRRIVSSCTGAFILAEAGILDGRRATTHWLHAHELAERFPKVRVEADRIFIQDSQVWTSAGATVGIEVALCLVEQDFGVELSQAIAKKMVLYHRRPSVHSQFSELLELHPKSDRIQRALAYARRSLQTPLSVTQLAQAAHLSPRQFSRAFQAETGLSPAKAVERIRVEAARLMLEQSRHTVDVIARETGFPDRSRMRRAFVRVLGCPPQAIRDRLEGPSMDLAASAVAP